jgi:hypothetical protein
MQFTTNSRSQIDLDIRYANKLISKAYDTQFLGIYIQRTLSWKIHIEQITHKISAACHPLGSVKPFMSQETLKIVDYVCFLSIMKYGLIFWGNSSHVQKFFKHRRI